MVKADFLLRRIIIIVSALCACLTVPASAQTATTSYTVCRAGSPSTGTGYVTAVFPVTKIDNTAWADAFMQFLQQKYAFKGFFIDCTTDTLENATIVQLNDIGGFRMHSFNVVETGWKYQ